MGKIVGKMQKREVKKIRKNKFSRIIILNLQIVYFFNEIVSS